MRLLLSILKQNYRQKFTFFGAYRTMSTESENSWRGVPLSEIYGSQSPWGAPEFRLVSPSYNHAVLYHVPSNWCVATDKPPKPQIGQDKWDQEHVRMPCSSQSLYPVEDRNGDTHLKKRWDMIEAALSKPLRNSKDLAEAILSYNTKFRGIWKFRGLHKLFNEYLEEEESQYFFDVTLPEIAKLALALPKLVQAPIPLLKQHKNRSISLSQQQIASLLANAFFCTFPRRNSTKKNSEYASYPFINFNTYKLYEATDSDAIMEKLKSICHYFRRVVTKVSVGTVTFTRRSVPPRDCPKWSESVHPIATLPLHVDSENTIEDADGLIQVDFANKFLGGGVLGHGCVQEEIRFVICPELMISMLFTEVMRPNEALIIIGCERYSKYSGYGHSYQWAGNYNDVTPRDSSGRKRVVVLAIDALPYSGIKHECTKDAITRELNKAWVGISFESEPQSPSQSPGLASGNWGCGAFGGTPQLKTLVQIMACAHVRRPLVYYTFGDVTLRDDIVNIYHLLARYNVTVGQLYKLLIKFTESKNMVAKKLYKYIERELRGDNPSQSKLKFRTISEPKLNVKSNNEQDEAMDTSITESKSMVLVETNRSPDLFSQDEIDQNVITVSSDSLTQNTQRNSLFDTIIQMEENEQECINSQNSDQNSLNSQNNETSDQSEGNNDLANQGALANQSKRMSLNEQTNNEEKPDPATELKRKKNNRKITDYFGKK